MHSLSQIHSQNETAARQENAALLAAAHAAGKSVILYLDELGQPDLSKTPTVFPTIEALTRYVNGSVPAHLRSRLSITYGTADIAPTATQPVPSGHQPNGSGLQNHSIGGIFPRIAVHYPFTNTWRIREPNGDESQDYGSYDEACNSVIA